MQHYRTRIIVGTVALTLASGVLRPAGAGQANDVLVLRPPATILRSSAWNSQKLRLASEVVERRLRLSGIESPSVVANSEANVLIIRIPQGKSAAEVAPLLTRPVALEIRHVSQLESKWQTRPELVHGRQTGFEEIVGQDSKPVSLRALDDVFARPPAFTGADFEPKWRSEQSSQTGLAMMHFEFKAAQKQRFKEFTRALIGKKLALFLDRRLVTAPTINDAISGVGIIEGRFSPEAARTLSIQLNSGPLPTPLEVVQSPRGR